MSGQPAILSGGKLSSELYLRNLVATTYAIGGHSINQRTIQCYSCQVISWRESSEEEAAKPASCAMSLALHGALSVIGYFTVNIGVGLWAAGRRIQPRTPLVDEHVPDYLLRLLLANRALPLSLGFISMTATWVGGGYVYGTAEAVFNYGLAWCHAPVGYAFSLLIGGVMFCEKMRAQKPLTMLDPFQAHYGRWIAVPLSLPAVLGELFWTAANLAALGESVSIIADLDPALAIVVSGSTILLYTSVGGLISVVYTDVLQALTTLVGLWACVPAVASSSATDRIRLPSYSWLGQIEIKDLGQMLDLLLMTTLGGIPWQRGRENKRLMEETVVAEPPIGGLWA
ncbi:hypothetical protein HPB48_013457 [Haemaphysalis longicornis]|uniref:Uncharacterized protein n=1 Tax=Haemaphysalis longicornis TaxID=44386 RepID=A0A9J6FQ13_HAELO|nr:hypothetical protein HPB48_013457 [Haemaphysalis longicornis]